MLSALAEVELPQLQSLVAQSIRGSKRGKPPHQRTAQAPRTKKSRAAERSSAATIAAGDVVIAADGAVVGDHDGASEGAAEVDSCGDNDVDKRGAHAHQSPQFEADAAAVATAPDA